MDSLNGCTGGSTSDACMQEVTAGVSKVVKKTLKPNESKGAGKGGGKTGGKSGDNNSGKNAGKKLETVENDVGDGLVKEWENFSVQKPAAVNQ